jgi:hypothetical protein
MKVVTDFLRNPSVYLDNISLLLDLQYELSNEIIELEYFKQNKLLNFNKKIGYTNSKKSLVNIFTILADPTIYESKINKLIDETIILLYKFLYLTNIIELDDYYLTKINNIFKNRDYKWLQTININEIIDNSKINDNILLNLYPELVDYNDIEEGKYYTINKKTNNKKKIIAESIFRMHNRNDRLPEYLSGILCTVNNLQKIMGDEWGYRIYIDNNFLRKNIFSNKENTLSYEYKGFSKNDVNKWKLLFENRDEGEIFKIFLEQLNKLDFVEIFKVTLKDQRLIDEHGYPVKLLGTNYRFHASTDHTKELVYIKDGDYGINKKIQKIWKTFEDSNKLITYYFFPWYKPPTHAIIEYPFTIIAYFWGIKPQAYLQKYKKLHYDFDDIFEYFINFKNDINNFFYRNECVMGGNINEIRPDKKASYGSDEIILTDLIFSGFKVKDTHPFAQKYDFNTIPLLYIIYENLKDNQKFINIMENSLHNTKNKINKYKLNNKIKKWDANNLQNFLFGIKGENELCCIFPHYTSIPDKNITQVFYYAYFKMIYDMVENNDNFNDNFRICYYKILHSYIKYLLPTLDDNQIMNIIYNHTFTNHSGWGPTNDTKRIILLNDNTYLFNRYYNIKIHIPGFFDEKFSSEEPFWGFISETIFESYNQGLLIGISKEIYELFFSTPKNNFYHPLWGPKMEFKKKYDNCVIKNKLNLIGNDINNNILYDDSLGGHNNYSLDDYDNNDYHNNNNYDDDDDNDNDIVLYNDSYGYTNDYNIFDPIKGDYLTFNKNIIEPYYHTYTNNSRQLLCQNTPVGKLLFNNNLIKLINLVGNDNINIINYDVNIILENILLSKDYKLRKNLMGKIYQSIISPKFHAIIWKMLEYIIKKTNSNNFILMDSGNSLALNEYNVLQYPWDDDIDIGFITDNNYNNIFDFLKKCRRLGFLTFIYKKVNNQKNNWYENMKLVELTDNNQLNFNPDNIWFFKLQMTENSYNFIKDKLSFKMNLKFKGETNVIPWIDIFPFVKKDGKYIANNINKLNLFNNGFIINDKKYKLNNGSEIMVPDNLADSLLKYKSKEQYMKQDNIYNHISGESFRIEYKNDEAEFIKKVIETYQKYIIGYIVELDYEDNINKKTYSQDFFYYKKYYKRKYINK